MKQACESVLSCSFLPCFSLSPVDAVNCSQWKLCNLEAITRKVILVGPAGCLFIYIKGFIKWVLFYNMLILLLKKKKKIWVITVTFTIFPIFLLQMLSLKLIYFVSSWNNIPTLSTFSNSSLSSLQVVNELKSSWLWRCWTFPPLHPKPDTAWRRE